MNAKRFLNGLVLVFLVTLGILSLPPVRTRVEKTLYPCKYSALVEQYAAEYDLDHIQDAYEAMDQRKVIKALIRF